MSLTITRRALKNKVQVIDLVEPHTCDDAHLGNITDAPKPIGPKTVFNEPTSFKEDETYRELDYVDRRDSKYLRQSSKPLTSSAPLGILDSVKGAKNG
jgi:hypothetical protein